MIDINIPLLIILIGLILYYICRKCMITKYEFFAGKSKSKGGGKPIDCVQSDWSDWSSCDRKCGNGKQFKRRTVKIRARAGGKKCGKPRETKTCSLAPCVESESKPKNDKTKVKQEDTRLIYNPDVY